MHQHSGPKATESAWSRSLCLYENIRGTNVPQPLKLQFSYYEFTEKLKVYEETMSLAISVVATQLWDHCYTVVAKKNCGDNGMELVKNVLFQGAELRLLR